MSIDIDSHFYSGVNTMTNTLPRIMILGVGNILLRDEGFGVRVIEKMEALYRFPENVTLMDGGVLGMHLLGAISEVDILIVVDAIRNNGEPGTVYRIDHEDIPERIRAKNSLHQIDFLEALTFCRYGLDRDPRTVIFGVEPMDIETYDITLTPVVQDRIMPVIDRVLEELDRLNVTYQKRECAVADVPGNSIPNC